MLRFSLLTSVAFLAMSPVIAQSYNRVISFGDSHSDNGNSLPFYGFTQAAPHVNGRLTNGLVWNEILARTLNSYNGVNGSMDRIGQAASVHSPVNNAANVNYAIAGWRGLDMAPIVDAYRNNGGAYGTNSLITVSYGSNDVSGAIGGGATAATINSHMQTSVNSIAAQMQRQIAQGGRNFLVLNLHDRGDAPFFAGTVNEAAARQGTLDFNAALPNAMRNVANANAGVNIIQMNMYGLQKAIQANPNAFGFTSSTLSCRDVSGCLTSSFSNQNKYFRWDQYHYTQGGHDIIARAAAITLNYGRDAARAHTLSDNAFHSRLSAMNRVFDKIAKAGSTGGFSQKGEVSLEALGELRSTIGDGNRDASSTSLAGAQLTIAKSINNAMAIGASASLQVGKTTQGKTTQGNITYDNHNMSFDGFMSLHNARYFLNGAVGFTNSGFDNWKRSHQLGDLVNKGNSKGKTFSASLEFGRHLTFSNFAFTPLMRLTGIKTSLDAFSEEGILAPIDYFARTSHYLVGAVEGRIDRNIHSFTTHGLVGAQFMLMSSGNSVTGNLANNTSLAQTTTVAAPQVNGIYLGTGVSKMFTQKIGMGIDYRAVLSSDMQHKVNGGVKMAF